MSTISGKIADEPLVKRDSGKATRVRRLLIDGALAGFILLAGWVYTHGIEGFVDIAFYDETAYLHRGVSIPTWGFPGAQWAPLYSSWYWLLSHFQPDKVELYYLNYKAMTVLPAVFLFLLLRTNHVYRPAALALSLVLLVSHANFPTWPKVSHFATVLLLFGLALGSICNTQAGKALLVTTFALLTSYARPEFFLSFVLLCCLSAFVVARRWRGSSGFARLTPIIAAVAWFSLIIVWGVPIGSGKGTRNRFLFAFGQHYSLNWVRWNQVDTDPWSNWESIVEADFGDVASPIEAARSNPRAFLRHLSSNLIRLPLALGDVFLNLCPRSFPVRIAAAFIVLLAAATAWSARGKSIVPWSQRIRQNLRHSLFLLILVAVLSVPVVASCLAIYPRSHYLLLLGILCGSAAAIVLFRREADLGASSSHTEVLLICLTALAMLRPLPSSFGRGQPTLKAIRSLRALSIKAPVRLLEGNTGYAIYAGHNYTRVRFSDKTESFSRFMRQNSINMIVPSRPLMDDPAFKNDPEWMGFVNDPASWGFVRLDLPAVEGGHALVHETLLPGRGAHRGDMPPE